MPLSEIDNYLSGLSLTFAQTDITLRHKLIFREFGFGNHPDLIDSLLEYFDDLEKGFALSQRSESWLKSQLDDLLESTPAIKIVNDFDKNLADHGLEESQPDIITEPHGYYAYLVYVITINYLSSIRPFSYQELPNKSSTQLGYHDAKTPSHWPYRPDEERLWTTLKWLSLAAPQTLSENSPYHQFDQIRVGHFFAAANLLLEPFYSLGSDSSNLLFPEFD